MRALGASVGLTRHKEGKGSGAASRAPVDSTLIATQNQKQNQHSLFMIGANGSVRGKKEFEPSSLAAESEPLLGPHLEDYWSHGGLLGPLWRTIG